MPRSKYQALKDYLSHRTEPRIPMTFAEIERIIGAPLPPSARRHRAWWSNNGRNNVMTRFWLEAGYRAAQVDIAGERLVFERIPAYEAKRGERGASTQAPRPLFGLLRGSLRIHEGVDVTAPAAPEWGERAEAEALRPLRQAVPEHEEC